MDAHLETSPTVATSTEKLAQLLERAHAHNKEHDPLRRFPPEVATSILHHDSQSSRPTHPMAYNLRFPTRPLELAAVCQHWRDLIIAEPRFWTTLVLRRDSRSTTDIPQEIVELWVERAGALKLNIVLLWYPVAEEPLDENMVALLKFICSLAPRWETVVFRLPSAALPIVHCETNTPVELEKFYLATVGSNGAFSFNDGPFSLGNTMIRPKIVYLTGISPPPAQILWTNVVDLTVYRAFPGEFLSILPTLTRVRKICASFIFEDTGTTHPTPATPIDLPRLTDLRIEAIQIHDIRGFFAHIRARRLNALSVTRMMDLEDPTLQLRDIRSLFLGSEALRVLTLSGISPESPEDMMVILENLPTLCMFSLTFTCARAHALSDALFTRLSATVTIKDDDSNDDGALTLQGASAKFLPNLIYLSYDGPRTFSWPVVADFVDSHSKCRGSLPGMPVPIQEEPSKLRPFELLHLGIAPKRLPEDFMDLEVVERLLTRRPENSFTMDIDFKLMRASLRHHGGIDDSNTDSTGPDFDEI